MFPFGASVITRSGRLGRIVRRLTNNAPYQYLAVTPDGKSLVLFQENLRLAADVGLWPGIEAAWDGVERREGHRRQRERRHDDQHRAEQLTSDRRAAVRRQPERRRIVTKST